MPLKDKDTPKLYFLLEHYSWPMRPAAFILHYVPFPQVDGVSYLLQEIYGIENKYNSQESKVNIRRHRQDFPVCSSLSALDVINSLSS